jgi:flagellar protein FlgJ
MTRQEFIDVIAPVAVKQRAEGSPIFPSVRIAQAILETGCVLHEWNNLVGYKVGLGLTNAYWTGRSVSTKTWEVYEGVRYDNVTANWRAYDTIEDCFRDQDLLFQWSRYDRVRAAQSPQEQTEMLRACGYATDPTYPLKLNSFISGFELWKYDVIKVEEEDDMKLELTHEGWGALAGSLQKAYDGGLLGDYRFVAKAYKGELTRSELDVANNLILVNGVVR